MLFSVLATLVASASAVLALPGDLTKRANPGINAPASGTVIQPNETFDFSYQSVGDYCASAYNTTVFLLTSLPTSFAPSADWADGHYFGRFDWANYPTDPVPSHPLPSSFVMPDFSIAPGGFGTGATGSNVTMYLIVLEEYSTCTGVLGDRIAFSMNQIIYNQTTPS